MDQLLENSSSRPQLSGRGGNLRPQLGYTEVGLQKKVVCKRQVNETEGEKQRNKWKDARGTPCIWHGPAVIFVR